MKKSEEVNLNEQMTLILNYAKRHQDLYSFCHGVKSLTLLSIQDLSFQNDINLFKELGFILSVIMSIISKPHLNNKREEIVARSGETSAISEEDFQKTLKDSSLWKEDQNGIMLPEHVYYHQYEDEIKIYENIFIVHMINEINYIVSQYESLYLSLLSVANPLNKELVEDDSMQLKSMEMVNKLRRRINRVKETYFYREVSKAKNKPKVFYPTNILVKDRLYNIVYKFYKKIYVYQDKEDINESLLTYYFALLVKILGDMDYEIDNRNKSLIYENSVFTLPQKVIFTSNDVRILLEIDKDNKLFKLSYKDKLDESVSTHTLKVESDLNLKEIKPERFETFTSEYISLWHLGEVNKDNNISLLNESLLSEEKLLRTFVESHHILASGSEKLYSSYCPACKSRNFILKDGYYFCPDCGSIYKFLKDRNGKPTNKIVFAYLAR